MEQTTQLTLNDRQVLQAYWRGEAGYRICQLLDPDASAINPFVSVPCFSRDEFCNKLSLPGWQFGTALHYKDLCFLHDSGHDQWYVYRGRTCVTFLALQPIIKAGDLHRLVDQLLTGDAQSIREYEFPATTTVF